MIRFYNGKTVIFDPNARITEDEVWVDGTSIYYVGPKCENMPKFENEIDLNGDVLLPGFKDAHTHTAMTFLRSLADDKHLANWLSEDVFPNEAKLTPDAVYNFTMLGIMEYLQSGITSSFDMYVYNDAYVKANLTAGFRTVICSGLNNFDSDITNIEREYLKFNSTDELISFRLGIHAEYTTGMDRLKYAVELGHKYEAPMFTHLSETADEVAGCIERYGMTPPMLLDSIGFFDYGGGGFHCVHMSDEDIDLFARKKLIAVTNPASNLKLASGIAPLDKMRNAGVELGIGTDGAASNNSLDMFREMYLASTLQKILNNNAAAGNASEVLKMACVGSAHAMGLFDCDNISTGKKADLIVISLKDPNMRPVNNIISNIVYSAKPSNVRLTMVNGKILYSNREYHIGEDIDRIYFETQKFVDNL